MTDHEEMAKRIVHCKDCCCARSWRALGVTEYTGKSIPEHIDELKAERDELNDEIERCCKELGDAGILITQGPRDGITKLINERDELKAERDAAIDKVKGK
jgi:uncharacterized coiled-coil DUF342 family protein